MEIKPASPPDLEAVQGLLQENALPITGVAEHFADFFVAMRDGVLLGAVCLEYYDPAALLRSLVVRPWDRGQGLGARLVETALEAARRKGIEEVYLLTETAATYFPRFGFVSVPRADVDPAVQASVEFQSACPESAACLKLHLGLSGKGALRCPPRQDAPAI